MDFFLKTVNGTEGVNGKQEEKRSATAGGLHLAEDPVLQSLTGCKSVAAGWLVHSSSGKCSDETTRLKNGDIRPALPAG